MANLANRRLYKEKEAKFADKKARAAYKLYNEALDGNLQKDIDIEDFKIDVEDILKDNYYYLELQSVLYWHNFDPREHFKNMYVPKIKIDRLIEIRKNNPEKKAGLIFYNCTTTLMYAFNIDDIKYYEIKPNEDPDEISIKFNIFKNKGILHNIEYIHKNNPIPLCDCMEHHKEIMEDQASRVLFANQEFNLTGYNYLCDSLHNVINEEE